MEGFIARWEEDLKSPSQDMRNAAALSMILFLATNISFGRPGQKPVEGYDTVLEMLGAAVTTGVVTSEAAQDWLKSQKAIRQNLDAVFSHPKSGAKAHNGPK